MHVDAAGHEQVDEVVGEADGAERQVERGGPLELVLLDAERHGGGVEHVHVEAQALSQPLHDVPVDVAGLTAAVQRGFMPEIPHRLDERAGVEAGGDAGGQGRAGDGRERVGDALPQQLAQLAVIEGAVAVLCPPGLQGALGALDSGEGPLLVGQQGHGEQAHEGRVAGGLGGDEPRLVAPRQSGGEGASGAEAARRLRVGPCGAAHVIHPAAVMARSSAGRQALIGVRPCCCHPS